jgi:Mrp family chromosome partitioning ATPase
MSRLAEAFRKASVIDPAGGLADQALLRDIVSGTRPATIVPWDLNETRVAIPAAAAPLAPAKVERHPIAAVRPTSLATSQAIPADEASALAVRVFAPGSPGTHPRAVLFAAAGAESSSVNVSASVAQALAKQTTRSVCLVEANLRSPALHSVFRAPVSRGFSDVLIDGGDVRLGLSRVATNLWLLPAGTRARDAVRTLNPEQLRRRITELLSMFDYLVVDAAPASEQRDTAVIAPLVDGAVIIVSANGTRREAARRTVVTLQEAGVAVLGAVLTDRTLPIPEAIYRRL